MFNVGNPLRKLIFFWNIQKLSLYFSKITLYKPRFYEDSESAKQILGEEYSAKI